MASLASRNLETVVGISRNFTDTGGGGREKIAFYLHQPSPKILHRPDYVQYGPRNFHLVWFMSGVRKHMADGNETSFGKRMINIIRIRSVALGGGVYKLETLFSSVERFAS